MNFVFSIKFYRQIKKIIRCVMHFKLSDLFFKKFLEPFKMTGILISFYGARVP